jgi:hypothetical protein
VTESTGTLVYLYGIVPADTEDPDDSLLGLEDRPVHLLRVGGVAAIVSGVPDAAYEDDALNARLDDLAWVGARGVAHERVLDWFAERGPVIPLSLFSLHRDLDRVRGRIVAEAGELERSLERLRGRKEWGIRLWRRDAEAREGIDRFSVSLPALTREIEEAPPGKRFLLERKRETMRSEELRTISARLAHELHAALTEMSAEAVRVPLPAQAAGGERSLILHAAYLVADGSFAGFRATVQEQAARIAGSGFEIEFTGPWPPYHFSGSDE